jgi:hypothetical protein
LLLFDFSHGRVSRGLLLALKVFNLSFFLLC